MTIFLVFLIPDDNGEGIDEDNTAKAFYSMEEAKTYRAELAAKDEVECIAFAKRVKASEEDFFYYTLYKHASEKAIANDLRSAWGITEISLS
jgi:hypothetical protein